MVTCRLVISWGNGLVGQGEQTWHFAIIGRFPVVLSSGRSLPRRTVMVSGLAMADTTSTIALPGQAAPTGSGSTSGTFTSFREPVLNASARSGIMARLQVVRGFSAVTVRERSSPLCGMVTGHNNERHNERHVHDPQRYARYQRFGTGGIPGHHQHRTAEGVFRGNGAGSVIAFAPGTPPPHAHRAAPTARSRALAILFSTPPVRCPSGRGPAPPTARRACSGAAAADP